jgi:hypothetical protein
VLYDKIAKEIFFYERYFYHHLRLNLIFSLFFPPVRFYGRKID